MFFTWFYPTDIIRSFNRVSEPTSLCDSKKEPLEVKEWKNHLSFKMFKTIYGSTLKNCCPYFNYEKNDNCLFFEPQECNLDFEWLTKPNFKLCLDENNSIEHIIFSDSYSPMDCKDHCWFNYHIVFDNKTINYNILNLINKGGKFILDFNTSKEIGLRSSISENFLINYYYIAKFILEEQKGYLRNVSIIEDCMPGCYGCAERLCFTAQITESGIEYLNSLDL